MYCYYSLIISRDLNKICHLALHAQNMAFGQWWVRKQNKIVLQIVIFIGQ